MGQTRTGKNGGARNGRVIMHLDMDAFFVNVELLENPALRGEPIIVAALGPRSVVCSASYEARAHGVRSGMPLSRARNLSPNATVLPLRGDYRHYSRAVMAILNDLSPYVEQVSVDEAFVDLTGAYLHGQDPVALAQRARDRIAQELSLPSSAGVAPNKLLAKMASTGSKPNGLWIIPPERVQEFLDPRKVSDLWGVGAKSTEQLSRYGIHTIAQMRSMSLDWLKERFGAAQGEHLWAMARGIDERPVLTSWASVVSVSKVCSPPMLFSSRSVITGRSSMPRAMAQRCSPWAVLKRSLSQSRLMDLIWAMVWIPYRESCSVLFAPTPHRSETFLGSRNS